MEEVKSYLDLIFQYETKQNLVENLLAKNPEDTPQTLYKSLCDHFNDVHGELSLEERENVIQRLIGAYVIKNMIRL